MNTALLEAMIVNRLESDTGAGGLFQTGSTIVSQIHNGFADPGDVLDKPYICMVIEDGQHVDAFTTDMIEVQVTFHIFDARVRVSDACRSTIDRIYGDGPKVSGPSYGLHRWSIGAITGSSVDTGAVMVRTGFASDHDKDFWHYTERYTVRVERVGS